MNARGSMAAVLGHSAPGLRCWRSVATVWSSGCVWALASHRPELEPGSTSWNRNSTRLQIVAKYIRGNVCKVLANVWHSVNNWGIFAIVIISNKNESAL